jgi:predicted P-loop ATPase
LSILGGDWFSETPFEISTNEGNMRIQGVWLQEMPEMGMFTKAEDTAFKSFLAITRDKYRRPYDRRPIEKPRICLFGGTTNLKQYLKDPTGNRRIWPVWCNEIDNEGLREVRDQLFAEALHFYRAGARCHPTRDEEKTLFEPEQRDRLIQEGWEEIIKNYLSNPEERIRLRNFFTPVDLLTNGIGMEKHKVDERQMMRIGRIMSKIGWERKRSPTGTRAWGYIRPEEQRESSIIFPVNTIAVPDFADD